MKISCWENLHGIFTTHVPIANMVSIVSSVHDINRPLRQLFGVLVSGRGLGFLLFKLLRLLLMTRKKAAATHRALIQILPLMSKKLQLMSKKLPTSWLLWLTLIPTVL